MDSYTGMSEEGVAAVKAAQQPKDAYRIGTAGSWTQDHQALRSALLDYQDAAPDLETAAVAEDLTDELFSTDTLLLAGESFDVLVDALVCRWESHGDESACSILSSIAETLGIEFI